MNETMVTLQGYSAATCMLRQAGEHAGRQLPGRLHAAAVPAQDRRVGRRRDQWYTVNAWRDLGEHCSRSLRRGDPVVVHGRLSQRSYVNKNNVEVTALEVEALLVGHDLSKGRECVHAAAEPAAASRGGRVSGLTRADTPSRRGPPRSPAAASSVERRHRRRTAWRRSGHLSSVVFADVEVDHAAVGGRAGRRS